MPKIEYQPLICGSCDLEFGIREKHYNPKDSYNCPICLSRMTVTPEDLLPPKPFRPKRKAPPTIVGRD